MECSSASRVDKGWIRVIFTARAGGPRGRFGPGAVPAVARVTKATREEGPRRTGGGSFVVTVEAGGAPADSPEADPALVEG